MPLAVGLAATAIPVITLFAGERYAQGATALAVIALASAVTCSGVVLNKVLLSIARTRVFLDNFRFDAVLLSLMKKKICVFGQAWSSNAWTERVNADSGMELASLSRAFKN